MGPGKSLNGLRKVKKADFFFRSFRLFPGPTNCPWVFEDALIRGGATMVHWGEVIPCMSCSGTLIIVKAINKSPSHILFLVNL